MGFWRRLSLGLLHSAQRPCMNIPFGVPDKAYWSQEASIDAGLQAMGAVPCCATLCHAVPGYLAKFGTKIGTKDFQERDGSVRESPTMDGLRNGLQSAVNRPWTSDITYIWTDNVWACLAIILGLFSRRIVGWEVGDRPDTASVCSALLKTLRVRRTSVTRHLRLIVHSDQAASTPQSSW